MNKCQDSPLPTTASCSGALPILDDENAAEVLVGATETSWVTGGLDRVLAAIPKEARRGPPRGAVGEVKDEEASILGKGIANEMSWRH